MEDTLDMNIMGGGERKGIVMSDLRAERTRPSGRGRREGCGNGAIEASDYRLVGWRRRRCLEESSPRSIKPHNLLYSLQSKFLFYYAIKLKR
jgi:hypothetical protein